MEETQQPERQAAPKHRTVRVAKPPQQGQDFAAAGDLHEQRRHDAVHDALEKAGRANGNGSEYVAAAPPAGTATVPVELPDGRTLTIGPPPYYTGFRIAAIVESSKETLTKPAAMMMQENAIKALLYIREIDGRPVGEVINAVQAAQLANLVGDTGMDRVQIAMLKHFSGATAEQLESLKKNLP